MILLVERRRPFGIGTFSLLIVALGFAFNYAWGPDDFRFGYYLFHQMNWPIYSKGDEGLIIPTVITAIFWIPAIIIARKHNVHYGTKTASIVAGAMLIICFIGPLVTMLDWIVNS